MKSDDGDRDDARSAETLLALCRRPEARPGSPGAEAGAPTAREVERLLASASRRSVTGLVLATLLDAELDLPASVRASLEDAREGHRRRARVWILERDRVAGLLARAQVAPVVLKGAALCTGWYADPAHREFGDIDLLVREDGLSRAVEALRDAGYSLTGDEEVTAAYREHHFHYRLTHPTGFVVELHWGLSRPGSLFSLSPGPFLEEARRVEGRPFRVPSPEHMLLHCVHQSLGTGQVQLRRLVDVDRIVTHSTSLDPGRLQREAARAGLAHPTWLALALADELLGTGAADLRRPLRPGPVTRAHLRMLNPEGAAFDRRHEERVALSHLLRLWLLPSVSARARFLAELGGGEEDPLGHLWEKGDGARPSDSSTRWRGLGRLLKLATAQLLLYGVAPFGGVRRVLLT